MAFTDKEILGLKPKANKYYATDNQHERGNGALWLLVRPTGKKVFYFVYKLSGKRAMIALGPYSKSNAGKGLTLQQARAKKDTLAAFLIQGLEPKAELARIEFEAEQDKRKQNQLGTVEQLFEGYAANMKANDKKSYAEVIRVLRNDAIPLLGKNTPANQVTSHDIKLVLHNMIKRGALVGSNRLRSYLSASFTYGLEHDNDPTTMDASITYQLERNPVRDVPKAVKNEKPCDRELSQDEIRQLWMTFNPKEPYSLVEQIFRLILTTGGQRVSEVSQAKWAEFNTSQCLWEIPASRTKNGKAHLIPLNEITMNVLDEIQAHKDSSPYLFPHRLDSNKPIPLATISRAANRFTSNKANNFEPFTPRDLRRTCKTRMGELGLSKEIRDRINNHALNDVSSRHYDRYDYLKEKQNALDAWGKRLEQIVGSSSLDNVVAINNLKELVNE
ncbi:MAG: tyrosine-type recombinase/integrase [Cycloclasticus sp.]|jgi:Integrase